MINSTVELLGNFTVLITSLLAVGYISNYLGLKLYASTHKNVNGIKEANAKAMRTGYISIAFIIYGMVAMQIFLGFDWWLIQSITAISIAFILSGYVTNTNFEN